MLLFAFSSHAQDNVIHVAGNDHSSDTSLSQLEIQSRLLKSAKFYEDKGHVARAAHYDFASPASREEYIQMNGFGILWVTTHSHEKEELPLKNVRLSMGGTSAIVLQEISEYASEEPDPLVSKVFGKYRSDAVYIVPLARESRGAKLLADYSLNRTDFNVGSIDEEFDPKIGDPIALQKGIKYPEKSVFETMLRREYPIFFALNMSDERYIPTELTWVGSTIEQQAQQQPFNTFRYIGNTIVCKTQTLPTDFACLQIGMLKVGDSYQFSGQPMQEVTLPKGDTASAFAITKTNDSYAYWVIGHKDGKITSVQLTGNHVDPNVTFSNIGLGDSEDRVRSLLGTRFNKRPVKDISGIEWDYYPFPFSFEFVNGIVYSIRIYDVAFCDLCAK